MAKDSAFKTDAHSYVIKTLNDPTMSMSTYAKPGDTWYVKVRAFYTKDGSTSSTRYGVYSSTSKVTVPKKEEGQDSGGTQVGFGEYAKVTASASISVVGKNNSTLIQSVKVGLYDKNGKVVSTWMTSNESHVLNDLTDGEKYTVKILSAPEKYIIDSSQNIFFIASSANTATIRIELDAHNEPVKTNISECTIVIKNASFPLYTYTGKAIMPSDDIVVKLNGKTLARDTDYKIAAYSNNVNVGTASVKVSGIGGFTGSVTKTFLIMPAVNKITSLTATNGTAKVSWTKDTQATGYELIYTKNKDFSSGYTTKIISGNATTSYTHAETPSAGETWRFKVRAYYLVNNTRYGTFSAEETVMIRESLKNAKVTITSTPDQNGLKVDSITVTSSKGKVLKQGTDYKYSIDNTYAEFQSKVTVTGINGYYDSISSIQNNDWRPSSVTLATTILNQLSSSTYPYTACTPTSVTMVVNGDKKAGWVLSNVVKYAVNNGLQNQQLRNGLGMTAPYAVELVSKYSGGKYTATNLYPTGTTYSTDKICDIIKTQLAKGHRVAVMKRLSSGSTHASTVYGYYYSGSTIHFKLIDPYGGYYVDYTGTALANEINNTIAIEPKMILIVN